MELILVRHGEPVEEHSSDGAPVDPALSERGRLQAEAVCQWLAAESIDAIVSSPARRARETAAPLASRSGLEVRVDDRFRDANPEVDRYVPLEVDRERDPAAYRARVADYRESRQLDQVSVRVNEAMDEWTARARGGRVVVFCHGSVVNVYAARVLGLEPSAFLEAAYASGHRFMISRHGIRSVRSLNETAYLAL